MVEIQYLTAKVQKLLQWCSCFKTVISWRPLGRITWPRDRFVAKGLYYIWSHQSEAGFPRVVAGRFVPRFEVSYCNAFWSHCRFYPSNLQVEVHHPLLSFLCPKVHRSLLFVQLLTIGRSSDNQLSSRMVRYDPSVLRYVTHYCRSSSCLQSVARVTIICRQGWSDMIPLS